MNERHKQLADKIVDGLRNANSVDEYELRKEGGEVYDVMKWLKDYEVITQTETGRPFTKGKKFYTYKNLDELLNPKEKKNWLDIAQKVVAIVGVLGTIYLGLKNQSKDNKIQELERENKQKQSQNDSLTKEIHTINNKARQVTTTKPDSVTTTK